MVGLFGFHLASFSAHRLGADNAGHDAHLGGAMVGLLTATALYPPMIAAQPAMFATLLGLSFLIPFLLGKDPWHLLERKLEYGKEAPGVDERFRDYDCHRNQNRKMAETDRLLDKVAQQGGQSLREPRTEEA